MEIDIYVKSWTFEEIWSCRGVIMCPYVHFDGKQFIAQRTSFDRQPNEIIFALFGFGALDCSVCTQADNSGNINWDISSAWSDFVGWKTVHYLRVRVRGLQSVFRHAFLSYNFTFSDLFSICIVPEKCQKVIFVFLVITFNLSLCLYMWKIV